MNARTVSSVAAPHDERSSGRCSPSSGLGRGEGRYRGGEERRGGARGLGWEGVEGQTFSSSL